MSRVIEVQKVTKRFGAFTAVDAISFSVSPGEIVGFVGANGAGKTTTISMLLGFIEPTSGTVKLFGQPVHTHSAYRTHGRIGYAAGDMELPAHLTGHQYISFLLHQAKGDHSAHYAALRKEFSPQLDKKIHELSRGNRQKVALVAAMVTNPDVLVLDEPTSGLDPAMQETFLQVVRTYQQQKKTVFMSSHYLQEISDVCSRVLLMRDGKIIQDVGTKELLSASGKQVRVQTTYLHTRPPKHAESVETSKRGGTLTLSFVFKGDMDELQRWLAGVKLLRDVEVTEYNLAGAFHAVYETSEEPSV